MKHCVGKRACRGAGLQGRAGRPRLHKRGGVDAGVVVGVDGLHHALHPLGRKPALRQEVARALRVERVAGVGGGGSVSGLVDLLVSAALVRTHRGELALDPLERF